VRAAGREGGPSGIMVLEDGQEGWFVSDVGDVLVVEIVEAVDEGGWSAKLSDEWGLGMRDEAGVE
jgi:hypothetical protein